ncbi:NUDIX domain-containing protein [Sporolactobacillus sp. STCC-11]|uniref:NUDIX domain-containing protein n=1 Tax=Sporolactobacillus caesalpiniae TaxID=3230362 RepID=UPI003394751B
MNYVQKIRAAVGHQPIILVVSGVLIIDGENRVLLQKRIFPKNTWGIPGGMMELGETTEETATREIQEETSLKLSNLKLFNVYSGSPLYEAENGDQYVTVTTIYTTNDYSGHLNIDADESVTFEFRDQYHLPEFMFPEHRKILNDYFDGCNET